MDTDCTPDGLTSTAELTSSFSVHLCLWFPYPVVSVSDLQRNFHFLEKRSFHGNLELCDLETFVSYKQNDSAVGTESNILDWVSEFVVRSPDYGDHS